MTSTICDTCALTQNTGNFRRRGWATIRLCLAGTKLIFLSFNGRRDVWWLRGVGVGVAAAAANLSFAFSRALKCLYTG